MADLEERIRRRAYELWEQHGRPEGQQDSHWEMARQEIMAESAGGGDPVTGPEGMPAAGTGEGMLQGAGSVAAPAKRSRSKPPAAKEAAPAKVPEPEPAAKRGSSRSRSKATEGAEAGISATPTGDEGKGISTAKAAAAAASTLEAERAPPRRASRPGSRKAEA
ncbi:DUF2934 domain-containing protein [Aerophototrophica crusticola]|uniref:DUF2934 domain-containing protein n=1 Tax=Aerophototrophica crusticola TaxID=1709002 RepID=A0A858R596_9PROT|nr:DUF2934 domain-containing protein [Rhodospirillaceae bacterium B3]